MRLDPHVRARRRGRGDAGGPGPAVRQRRSPRRDASPDQIVRGFLAAQAQGARGSFDVASEFLTRDAQDDWSPVSQVAILEDVPQLDVDEAAIEGGTTTVRATADVVGTVDERGVYTEQAPGRTTEVSYGLVRDADDQWRIDVVDDGLTITATNFAAPSSRPTSTSRPSTGPTSCPTPAGSRAGTGRRSRSARRCAARPTGSQGPSRRSRPRAPR
ncbi:hypothetical protein IU11_16695 [Cellulosimicrobium sp. MM]|nr:hypothetical protein [Cellulosimicrobium sp. MM]KFD42893.1 hypothetical protein IU11_16695 [Cellulosimicrobium sp. MM]